LLPVSFRVEIKDKPTGAETIDRDNVLPGRDIFENIIPIFIGIGAILIPALASSIEFFTQPDQGLGNGLVIPHNQSDYITLSLHGRCDFGQLSGRDIGSECGCG
jgi:hypothetical protein